MKTTTLLTQAQSLRGCLSHYRTTLNRRLHSEDEDPFQLPDSFVGDDAKIISSKAYRGMAHKTQVATMPTNINIRSRLTHVLEVKACSIVVSEMLGLNTSLVGAIADGHDIGHVPFGHQGEKFMAETMGKPEFCHEVMGPIIAQKIEREGKGLNLSHQVLEGMMCHSGARAKLEMSKEAWVVRYIDKIYFFHDYNDFKRMGYPTPSELDRLMNEFGQNQRERITTMMSGLIVESHESDRVKFDDSELAVKLKKIRELMYGIYTNITQQDTRHLMEPILNFLTRQKIGDPFLLLALMTDKDVIRLAHEPMLSYEHLKQTAISEIFPHLEKIGKVDLCDPCLDW